MSPAPGNPLALPLRLRPALAAALALVFLMAPSAQAHEDEGAPAAEVPEHVIVEALGGDAEQISDHLYEVDVPHGPDLVTHGPDLQLDNPQERASGFSAGDPQRPPVCATDHYQQVLYGHLAGAADR